MALAYILSRLSLTVAKKLEQSGKFTFFVKVLIVIHYFSSVASLFIGLFMHHQEEHVDNLQKHVDELASIQHDLNKKTEFLENENKQLLDKLHHEQYQTEKRSHEEGYKSGYCNGYAVGFEDCGSHFSIQDLPPQDFMRMARMSGIHRLKSRPTIFDETKATERDGILT